MAKMYPFPQENLNTHAAMCEFRMGGVGGGGGGGLGHETGNQIMHYK